MSNEFGIFTGDQLIEGETTYQPLIEGLLYRGDKSCLAAVPKMGKSVWIQQMAFNLTTGEDFLGKYRVHGQYNVLWLQGEVTKGEIKKRILDMERCNKLNRGKLFHANLRGYGLQRDNHLVKLTNQLQKAGVKNIDVVIVDPLYRFLHGGNLIKDDFCIAWANNFDKLLGMYGASAIVVHHDSEKRFVDNKGIMHKQAVDTLLGTTFWSAYFTHAFKLTKKNGKHYLNNAYQRSGDVVDQIKLKMIVPQRDKRNRLVFELQPDDLNKVELLLLKENKLTIKEIKKKLKLKDSAVYGHIQDSDTIIKDGDYFRHQREDEREL